MLVDIHSHRYGGQGVVRVHSASLEEWWSASPTLDGPISLGVHPWDVASLPEPDQVMDCLAARLEYPGVALMGEIGLDKVCRSPWDLQCRFFLAQLQLASDRRLPVVIHCVKAMDSVLAFKKRFPDIPYWIIHGFRGKHIQMTQWLSNGFWISFGLQSDAEAVRLCPLDRMFLETDEGEYGLAELYQKTAGIKGCSINELEARMESNARMMGIL